MKQLKRSECAILPLVLKGKWYDMIESGEKKEEYRDKTDYWRTRILNWLNNRKVKVVEFRLGYAKNAKRMAFKMGDVFSRTMAHTHTWGEPETPHYAIVLSERVELVD